MARGSTLQVFVGIVTVCTVVSVAHGWGTCQGCYLLPTQHLDCKTDGLAAVMNGTYAKFVCANAQPYVSVCSPRCGGTALIGVDALHLADTVVGIDFLDGEVKAISAQNSVMTSYKVPAWLFTWPKTTSAKAAPAKLL